MISKMLLLGHSRAFNEELRNKNIGVSNKFLIEQDKSKYVSKSLLDFFKRPTMNLQQIQDKMMIFGKKIRAQREKIDEVAEDISHNQAGDGAIGKGYVTLAQAEDTADDQSIQITRMYDLIDTCEKRYDKIQDIINEKGLPEDSKEQFKLVDAEIWNIEVDLENIGDI